MLKLLRKTYLWVLALPLAISFLGAASNQAVLYANHDCFPVRVNGYKIARHALVLNKAAQSEDPDEALQAQFALEALDRGYLDDTHVIMTSKTHLNLLADNFDFKDEGIESIGDLGLDLGSWLWSFAPLTWGILVVRKLKETQ